MKSREQVIQALRILFPNLVQQHSHYESLKGEITGWLRWPQEASHMEAMNIAIPVAQTATTDAALFSWSVIADLPIETIRSLVEKARLQTTPQASQKAQVNGGVLSVSRESSAIVIRIDF